MLKVEIGLDITSNTIEAHQTNLTPATLLNPCVVDANIRQYRNRMLQVQRGVGSGIAAQVQVVFNINQIVVRRSLTGQIGIPVTYTGTQTNHVRLGQRRHQNQ